MSYTSESILPSKIALAQVREIIAALGYKKVNDGHSIPDRVGSYFWYQEEDYHSYVGVELDIYRTASGELKVETRSRVSRSYWDLTQ